MKKTLLICLWFVAAGTLLSAQVVNYAKTLPVRTYSLGVTSSWYFNNDNLGLRSIGVEQEEAGALVLGATGGYSLNYSLDLGAKFMYVHGGKHFFGIDLQYLVHEARQSYVSVVGGVHYWGQPGVDLTGLFTYSPRYQVNLSTGIDMDVNYNPDMDSKILTRFWLPVNVGFNVTNYTFVYAEFDLALSQWAWGMVSLGATFVMR